MAWALASKREQAASEGGVAASGTAVGAGQQGDAGGAGGHTRFMGGRACCRCAMILSSMDACDSDSSNCM